MRRHFQKKAGRQTDKHFFSKRHLKWLSTPQSSFSTIQKHEKRFKKPLKQFCDGPTDRRTDRPTDRPTEKWLIESRNSGKIKNRTLFFDQGFLSN